MFSFLCRSATAQSSWRGLCLSPKSKLQRKSSLFQKIFNLWENIPSFRKYSFFQKIFTFSGKFTLLKKKHRYRSSNLERKFATNFGFSTKVHIWNKHGMLQELHISSTGKYSSSSRPTGGMFSYCGRARAYTHVLARVYSTRASTCTIYTCFTLPPTRVDLTGLQVWVF